MEIIVNFAEEDRGKMKPDWRWLVLTLIMVVFFILRGCLQ